MDLQQINQRIAVVNAESKRLNNERQVLIGKRQTLDKQLSDALAAYKATYGVELTAENIEDEVARVSAMKEAEVTGISTMLALIKEGRYDEAEKLAKGDQQVQTSLFSEEGVHAESESVVPPMPKEMQNFLSQSAPSAGQPVQVTQEMQETQPMQAPIPPAPPVETPPAPPVSAPPVETPPAPPAPPTPPAQPAPVPQPAVPVSGPVDEPPLAPPPSFKKTAPQAPLGTPKLGVPPAVGQSSGAPGGMSFQAILSGQAFNPQNGG